MTKQGLKIAYQNLVSWVIVLMINAWLWVGIAYAILGLAKLMGTVIYIRRH